MILGTAERYLLYLGCTKLFWPHVRRTYCQIIFHRPPLKISATDEESLCIYRKHSCHVIHINFKKKEKKQQRSHALQLFHTVSQYEKKERLHLYWLRWQGLQLHWFFHHCFDLERLCFSFASRFETSGKLIHIQIDGEKPAEGSQLHRNIWTFLPTMDRPEDLRYYVLR